MSDSASGSSHRFRGTAEVSIGDQERSLSTRHRVVDHVHPSTGPENPE